MKTDYKSGEETSNWTVDEFDADLLAVYDYYPFGFAMASRTGAGYRFGFNGKEKDNDEEWGNLTHYDYGFRIYNPALGWFLSVDPLAKKRIWMSPYNYVQNNPILRIDLSGALDNPIFDENGNFLGTDSEGFKGKIVIIPADIYNSWTNNGQKSLSHSITKLVVEVGNPIFGQSLDDYVAKDFNIESSEDNEFLSNVFTN